MSNIPALDLSLPFSSLLLPPPDTPKTQAEPFADPPSPIVHLPPPVRPAPCSRTVSAPVNPFMVSEAVSRIYLRDRVKRLEFSRAASSFHLSLGSVGSPLRQCSSAASIHSEVSNATSHPASSRNQSTTHIRWHPERVRLPSSVASSIIEPDTPFDDLGLPHNGSEVPLLWNVEEFSCWDIAFRRIVGPLANLLANANLLLTQTAVSLAGMNGSCDPKQMRVVVTILLDEQDIDKVLGVGEVQSAVEALIKQRFTETPAIPPVRYWVKQEARMIWEQVKLDGVQTFSGREPRIRKELKIRDPEAEDEIAALRKYDQAWRLGLRKKIAEKRKKEKLEREEKMAQRVAERQATLKEAASTTASLQLSESTQSTVTTGARKVLRRVFGGLKGKSSRATMSSETMPRLETETTSEAKPSVETMLSSEAKPGVKTVLSSRAKPSVETKASSVDKRSAGAEKGSRVQADNRF